MKPAPMVLTHARVWRADEPDAPSVDIVMTKGRIDEMVPGGTADTAGRERIDLGGRWVMPGMVDHHVHFTLWAKHRGRLSLAGARSAVEAAQLVREALIDQERAGEDVTVPLIGRSYQDALWPDLPTAVALDEAAELAGQRWRPIVLVSHDLHSVWINTAASTLLGVDPGLLREEAAFGVEIALERLEAANSSRVESLVREAVTAANARGVTGIMDLEMADNPANWAARVAAGVTGLRVRAGVYPQHLEATASRGERTGTRVRGTRGLVTVGPLKVFADGALNTRTAWCFDAYPHTEDYGYAAHARGDLYRMLADARQLGFDVALHAIGDRAVAEALDAFEATGARGTIEHAQLVRDEDLARFAHLGVGAGVHPEHALDDRAVSDALWAGRTRRAFPYASLAATGARLFLGSDAPVAPLDPWVAVSAAVHRTRDDQPPWEPENALSLPQAFAATWSAPSLAAGMLADVVALDADPRGMDASALRSMPVAATIVGGAVAHLTL